jgi:hypothetical protein
MEGERELGWEIEKVRGREREKWGWGEGERDLENDRGREVFRERDMGGSEVRRYKEIEGNGEREGKRE